MKVYKKFVGLLVVSIVLLSVHGNANSASTCENGTTVIYYVNGVYNTFAQAQASRLALWVAYKNKLETKYEDESQTFVVKLSYNINEGAVEDILEVARQKIDEQGGDASANIVYTIFVTGKDVIPFLVDKDKRKDNETVANAFADSLLKQAASSALTDMDYEKHKSEYLEQLQKGNRVLLIAHSQGNLFANASISSLMNEYRNNIGMIGVATPAGELQGNSTYYTAYDDRVINALRKLSTVLPANIENDMWGDARDSYNHAFLQSYFNEGLPSRTAIDSDVYSNMETLQCNPDLDGDGHNSTDRGGDDCDDRPAGEDGIPGTADDGAFIYPGATDIPVDGIDQDCDGADATSLVYAFPCPDIFPMRITNDPDGSWDWPLVEQGMNETGSFTCSYKRPEGLSVNEYPESADYSIRWTWKESQGKVGCDPYNFITGVSSDSYQSTVTWKFIWQGPDKWITTVEEFGRHLLEISESGSEPNSSVIILPGPPLVCE